MPSKYSPWLEMQSFSQCIHFLKASRYAVLGTVNRVLMHGRFKCMSHVGTGISAPQGMISISETKRNHMGQDLENTGRGLEGGGKTVTFSFFKNAVIIAEV